MSEDTLGNSLALGRAPRLLGTLHSARLGDVALMTKVPVEGNRVSQGMAAYW